MAGEVAKCLKLVAPSNMGAEQQTVWLHAAVDALEDIRADEVRAISAELRRSVTRAAQIVPEISKLVAARRATANRSQIAPSPYAGEVEIHRHANELRAAAGKDRHKLSDAFEWERRAMIAAGLHVRPYPKALSRDELDNMAPHIRQMGLNSGFLEYRDGRLMEA